MATSNISSCCIYSESEEDMALKLYTWLNFFMEISFYPVFKEKPYNCLDILMKFTEDLLHVLNMNHWKSIIDFMGKMEDFVTFEKVWIHLEKSSFRKRLEALCTSVEKKRLNIHNIQLEQCCTASGIVYFKFPYYIVLYIDLKIKFREISMVQHNGLTQSSKCARLVHQSWRSAHPDQRVPHTSGTLHCPATCWCCGGQQLDKIYVTIAGQL